MPAGDVPGRESRADPVAVCALTERALAADLRGAEGAGLIGSLVTANLGIERVIWAILDRPYLRFLLVCGTDSPVFMAGQSLIALVDNGIDESDMRITGAAGYMPFLYGVTPSEVAAFRRQISLIDMRGESDRDMLRGKIAQYASRVPSHADVPSQRSTIDRARRGRFAILRPGGKREPFHGAGRGFFVITLDRGRHQIVADHYWPNLRPGYQMRGVRAESMLLGLLAAGVVAELSHAGYLGGELAKAETALRLGLDYQQDKPLRSPVESRSR